MARIRAGHKLYQFEHCAVVVTHAGDESLWVGGTMLLHPDGNWKVVCLCGQNDRQTAEKFHKAMEYYNASGFIGDLDDSGDKPAISQRDIRRTLSELMPMERFDLVITHSIWGEYSRHRGHADTAKALLTLRRMDELLADEVWMFAYEEEKGKNLPRPSSEADEYVRLGEDIRQQKYKVITEVYGFDPQSPGAKCMPSEEAFWILD